MKVLVAGDFCVGMRVNDAVETGDYAQMFNAVRPVIADSDISIVNFEFPVVSGDDSPIAKVGPALHGSESAVEALRYAGFNVCTLANNHILDYGERNCIRTRQVIEKSGIKTLGAGGNLEQASETLFIKVKNETIGLINCCEHEFSIASDNTAGANPLNPIAQYYKIREAKASADYVVVIVHGGIEHYQHPTPRMLKEYRFFVDAGADAVVNHHQHCSCGYEIYKGKPIFYGLGNFLFDHNVLRNAPWNEGYMVELTLNRASVSFNIIPYRQCGDTPSVTPLDKESEIAFKRRINDLNEIIASPYKLSEQQDKYSLEHRRFILSCFTPWTNRWLLAAYIRGLLPSFLNKRKRLVIKNRVTCESHRELTIKELNR